MRHGSLGRPRAPQLDPALVDAILCIPVPAFVISTRGELLATNAAGEAWLGERSARAAKLAFAGGPDPEIFRVTPSRTGKHSYCLAVLRRVDTRTSECHLPARWGLTPREREVTACIMRGVTNQHIATELGCANATVERHVSSILRKANVANRASLIVAIMSE